MKDWKKTTRKMGRSPNFTQLFNERIAPQCALCGAFLPFLREGAEKIKCGRCGTIWEQSAGALDKHS